MHPYRVFVSYSREDRELASKLVEQMASVGLVPVWDKNIRPGDRFSDKIKHGIAHAHAFLAVLTPRSARRPWVHQETGYAMGLDIPVIPLAIGTVPKEMTRELEAMTVRDGLADLRPAALAESVEQLLRRDTHESDATYQCAAFPEQRADYIARYAREALAEKASGPLRQAGAMSSFCLPSDPPSHEVWRRRDEPVERGDSLRQFQYQERLALDSYVRRNGCCLVINPYRARPPLSQTAVRTRLATLLAFLEDPDVTNVRVVMNPLAAAGTLTIVGDWFSAESIVPRPGKGYYQTMFTWHAPSVLKKIHQYDREFDRMFRQRGLDPESSRKAAADEVKRAMDEAADA